MTSSTFNCPYCWADVPHQASVCAHCARDLVLFKPLAVRLQELTQEITQLQKTVELQGQVLSSLHASAATATSQAPATRIDPGLPAVSRNKSSKALWLIAMGTFFALALSHWVMFFLYDAPPLYLRLLTIFLPMLLGFLAARHGNARLPTYLAVSVLLGITSVAGMLALTAYLDQVPWLPTSLRDWRETLEYSSSITLAFFTGFLLDSLLGRLKERRRSQVNLKVLLERDSDGQYKIAAISKQVESLVSALAPVASAGTALYAGLKVFLGT